MVEAAVSRAGEVRRATAAGRDIYGFTAPLACEAADFLRALPLDALTTA